MNKIKKNNSEISSASQPTKENIESNMRLKELDSLRITTQTTLAPEKAAVSIDGVPIFEIGDIGAVKAKQKAGKTTMLKTMVAAWMKGSLFRLKSELMEPKVLWLDTEQKLNDVKRIIDDVKQMSGMDDAYIDAHLKLYPVRTLSYKTLLGDTKLLVNSNRPDVLIIDGLVDFIESFNDEAMSHQLISELVILSDKYKCAIIAVLHENKSEGDHNMRGHLGTMLAQKAGTVLQCNKDNNVITVSCSDARHAAMPSWRIMYDEHGHIVSADYGQQTSGSQLKVKRMKTIEEIIKENKGVISRKTLSKKLEDKLGLSRPRISNIITEYLGSFITEKDGNIELINKS